MEFFIENIFKRLKEYGLNVTLNQGSILLMFLVIFSLLGGCKEKEYLPPVIEFIQPFENSGYDVGDTIYVVAEISSEREITDLDIGLVRPNGLLAQELIDIETEGNFHRLEIDFYLHDLSLEDGIYQLRITARDSEEAKRKYRQIRVFAIPRELEAYSLMIRTSFDQKSLLVLDPNLNALTLDTLYGDHLGHRVISSDGILISAGKTFAPLLAWDINAQEVLWQIDPIPNPPVPFFTSINKCGEKIIMGYQDGYTRTYKAGGQLEATVVFTEGRIPYYATIADGVLFVDEGKKAGPERYLNQYFYPSGALKISTYPGLETKLLAEGNGKFIWVGNELNGNGSIRWLDTENGSFYEPVGFPDEPVYAAAQLGTNDYIISSDQGLYWYRVNPSSLILINTDIVPEHLVWEDETETLIACKDSTFYLLAYPSGKLLGEYPTNGRIFDAWPIYTR